MRPPHNTKTISIFRAVDSKVGQSMSWRAQNRSKDAKTPSAGRGMSQKPELDCCPVQPYHPYAVSTPIARRYRTTTPVFRRKCSGVDVDVISIYNFSHSHPRNNPLKAVEYATEIAILAFLRGVYPLESVGYDREPIVIWKGLVEIFRMSYLHPPSD